MPRSRLPYVLVLAAAAVALGGFLVFQQFLAGDSVPQLTLPPVATTTTAPATDGAASGQPTPAGGASPSTGTVATTPAALAGTWSIGDGSVVGYRVREQLGAVTALTDAVGRTSAISG